MRNKPSITKGVRDNTSFDLPACPLNSSGREDPAGDKEIDGRSRLSAASLLCAMFIVFQITGGYFSNSLAIINEALHQVFDLNSLLMSLVAAWIARWQPNEKKTFGYFRAEVLGAFSVIFALWLLTGLLMYQAVQRIVTGPNDASHSGHVNADVMMLTAGLSCTANIAISFLLKSNSHSHSRSGLGTSHQSTTNINIRAAFYHTLGDVIHSVAVLIAASIIRFKPAWQLVDPICTLLGSCIVLAGTTDILLETVVVLLESVPSDIEITRVKQDIFDIGCVRGVHDLHIWSLIPGKTILTAHVLVENTVDTNKFLLKAHEKLTSKYNLHHSSIQVEYFPDENNHRTRQVILTNE